MAEPRRENHESVKRTARRVAHFQAIVLGVACVAIFAYLAAITQGVIEPDDRLSAPEITLGLVVLAAIIFSGQLRGYSVKDLTLGTGGLTASFERIEARQESLESEVKALQVALTGLVTKFEMVHLAKLAGEGAASVRFGEIMLSELTHLDAMQFVRPVDPRGLNALRQDHGSGLTDFNLKSYVEITREGLEYSALRAELNARTAAGQISG
jgi:hypothetical protein